MTPRRRPLAPILGALILGAALAGCKTPAEEAGYPAPAVAPTPAPAPVQVVEGPRAIPMPGQLQPLGPIRPAPKPVTRVPAVELANRQSLQTPDSNGFINAMMVYDYMASALYQVYAAPQKVTDIEFEPGEELVSFAAGDTVRWLVDKTFSGAGRTRQDHLLIKPVRSGLENTLVVTTTRRSYHLQLRSLDSTYMASVSWRYADVGLTQSDAAAAAVASTPPVAPTALEFGYKIDTVSGESPAWKPDVVFTDGSKVYIRFPQALKNTDAPVLYVVDGDHPEIVNYRVQGNFYIVDRVFNRAELRVGEDRQTVVQIARNGS
jgi:type IV secretion system protein VirB9